MANNTYPLVSVGIPTFNRPDGLGKTLQCILDQTYLNLEVIVSDNCSLGNESELMFEKYSSRDTRIRYYRQDKNIGAFKNFEFVLSKANGKYFMWMADDDLCKPHCLALLVEALEKKTDAVLCGCDIEIIDAEDVFLRSEKLKRLRNSAWKKVRKGFFSCPISNIFYVIYGLYRTEIIQAGDIKLNPGWHGYAMGAEIPFLAKVALKGEIISVAESLKYYRYHDDSAYVREVSKIQKWDFFLVKQAIRIELIKIIHGSSLQLGDKLGLYVQVVVSAVVGSARAIFSKLMSNKLKTKLKKLLED